MLQYFTEAAMKRKFPMNKTVAFVMAVFHIGAFAALFYPTWHRILLFLLVWSTTSSFGIGVGYHRLLTHKGFKTYKWLEYTLAVIAALSQQGLAITWVALHNIHHAFTEVEGKDPHTPRDGTWWAHMDWTLHPDPSLQDRASLIKWAPTLARQPFYRLRYIQWLPTAVLSIVCFLWGGITTVLWGVAVPVVVGLHQTWLVNSATHLWGRRRFKTDDDSRNNLWIALLTWGEGWHNTHHKYPWSSQHGYAWWEIDVNWYIIWTLERLGLAWDVKTHHRSERRQQPQH